MRLLLRAVTNYAGRPRHVAAVRELSDRRPARPRWSLSIPSTCTCASDASSCSSRSTYSPEEIFTRLRLLLLLLDSWLAHAQAYAEMIVDALRARLPPARSSSSAATTATCCSTSSQRGIPVLGIEPAAQRRRGRDAQGRADAGRVLRRADGARARRERPPGRSPARQQRARAGAGPERLRRRDGAAARAGRRRHPRVSAPAAADGARTSSTPSITSTSPTSRSHAPNGSSPRTGCALRRRGAAHPRRLAPDLRAPRAHDANPRD